MMKTIVVAIGAASVAAVAVMGASREAQHAEAQNVPPQPSAVLTPGSAATLRDAPDGVELGKLSGGAQLSVLTRERGWVRVRTEGWMLESELVPADSNLRMSPSAADVRSDPAGMKGRLVRWEVEFIAFLRADPLRRDMTDEEWYLLARGPGSERAIVYLVVPAGLRSAAESLPPLSRIIVTARVRVGRSQPAGVPILDVESLARR
jgi:hypothetical protein